MGKRKGELRQHELSATIPSELITVSCELGPSFFIVMIISACISLNVFDLSFECLYKCHNSIKGE